MRNGSVERRMHGSSAYIYNLIRVDLDEPVLGDNRTLRYEWKVTYADGRIERGTMHRYFFDKHVIDDECVREDLVSHLFRSCDPELIQTVTPVWRRKNLPSIPFRKAA